jgi:hypothetical protein
MRCRDLDDEMRLSQSGGTAPHGGHTSQQPLDGTAPAQKSEYTCCCVSCILMTACLLLLTLRTLSSYHLEESLEPMRVAMVEAHSCTRNPKPPADACRRGHGA